MPDPKEEVIEAGEDPSEINSEEPTVYGGAKYSPGQAFVHKLDYGQIVPVNQADRLIELAISSHADVDRLDKLLDLKERYDREEARKQFTAALALFKSEDVQISKDKGVGYSDNKGNWIGYKHASLGNVVNTAVPHMSRHGLSHRWNVVQADGIITVTCILTHQGGHSEAVSMFAAPDDTGKKNSIQQVASTVTYLERYTFLSITGLAVEDQLDDDGAKAAPAPVELITEEQAMTIHAMITDNDIDMDIFLRWLANTAARAGTIEDIPAPFYDKVITKIEATIKAKQ